MPITDEMIEAAVSQYERERDRFEKLAGWVEGGCRRALRRRRIGGLVMTRTKDPESFRGKLRRWASDDDDTRTNRIASASDCIDLTHDLAAARVVTYREGDRARASWAIAQEFGDRVHDIEEKDRGTGYRAIHIEASIPSDVASTDHFGNVASIRLEIQVCGLLDHVWNEVEHDVRYKTGELSEVSGDEIASLESLRSHATDAAHAVEDIRSVREERVASHIASELTRELRLSEDEALSLTSILVRMGCEQSESALLEARAFELTWEHAYDELRAAGAMPTDWARLRTKGLIAQAVLTYRDELLAVLQDADRLGIDPRLRAEIINILDKL